MRSLVNKVKHGVKSVRIRSYSGPHFLALGLNKKRYGVSFRIQSKYGEIRTRITPNTDTFDAVKAPLVKASGPLDAYLEYANIDETGSI